MGPLIILAEEEGPVIEEEAAAAGEAISAEAGVLAEEAKAAGQAIATEAETLAGEIEAEGKTVFDRVEQALSSDEIGETTAQCEAEGSNAADAVKLQERATELQNMREPWMAERGTTAVIRGQDPVSGEVRDFISTEGETMPPEWEGQLSPNEQVIEGEGHAEETILNSDETSGFELNAGGTSRNVCSETCQPLIEENELELGGQTFRGAADKTPYRTFWK
jgi:hypothetical protein